MIDVGIVNKPSPEANKQADRQTYRQTDRRTGLCIESVIIVVLRSYRATSN